MAISDAMRMLVLGGPGSMQQKMLVLSMMESQSATPEPAPAAPAAEPAPAAAPDPAPATPTKPQTPTLQASPQPVQKTEAQPERQAARAADTTGLTRERTFLTGTAGAREEDELEDPAAMVSRLFGVSTTLGPGVAKA